MCVHVDFVQQAEKAPIKAFIPPTELAITMIIKFDSVASIDDDMSINRLLFNNNNENIYMKMTSCGTPIFQQT
jgi:hypothetical protein